uniref:MFS transporter n=1 Tax=Streptomyces sp. NRRL B-24720 TaxID=1476876 RepID=UPI0004C86483
VIGWISDRYGRRNTLIIVCLVLGSAQFGVFFSGDIGSMPFFLFCSMVSGFGGGAIFPLFAAMTADYFGENNNASNYGMVYSSKLISGLVGRVTEPAPAPTAGAGFRAIRTRVAASTTSAARPTGRSSAGRAVPKAGQGPYAPGGCHGAYGP